MASSSSVPFVLDLVSSQRLPLPHFSYLCFFRSLCMSFSAFMASSSMAELRSHGIGVPILFPIDAQGIAVVSEIHLSLRFSLKPNTIWVEREIFHPDTGLLVHTFHETSKVSDNGIVVWELAAGKYRVSGWSDSQIRVSTEILTPLRSSIAAFSTPPLRSVKTEPDLDNVID
jgi:hypothetical protein